MKIKTSTGVFALALPLLTPAGIAQQTTYYDVLTAEECWRLFESLPDGEFLTTPDGEPLTRDEKVALLYGLLRGEGCRFRCSKPSEDGHGEVSSTTAATATTAGADAGVASSIPADGVQGDLPDEVAEQSPPAETGDGTAQSIPAGDVQGDLPDEAGETGATADGNGAAQSIPAGGIQGDLPDETDTAGQPSQPATQSGSPPEQTAADQTGNDNRTGTQPNGKLPDDIPPVENDDIIAKQLRQAAESETDPAVKANLWNEYRRYKNLPVKETPES